MTLAKLLERSILLSEGIAVSVLWIIENESGLVEDRDFIGIFEFSAFVSSYNGFIDKGAIA